MSNLLYSEIVDKCNKYFQRNGECHESCPCTSVHSPPEVTRSPHYCCTSIRTTIPIIHCTNDTHTADCTDYTPYLSHGLPQSNVRVFCYGGNRGSVRIHLQGFIQRCGRKQAWVKQVYMTTQRVFLGQARTVFNRARQREIIQAGGKHKPKQAR